MRTVRKNFWAEQKRNYDSRGHWGLGGRIVPDFFRSGDYWIVKSARVHIQGRYSRSGGWALDGVAVGGPFLDGHTLVMERLWDGTARTKWDGQDVAISGGFSVQDLVDITDVRFGPHGLLSATVQLPEGVSVKIDRNVWNGGRSAESIGYFKMRKQPDGQDGHCGKADGNLDDDTKEYMLANWGSQVPSGENMFSQAGSSFLAVDAERNGTYDPAEVCANNPPAEEDARACEVALNGTAEALRDALMPGCIIDSCAFGPEAANVVASVAETATEDIILAGDPSVQQNPDGWYAGAGRGNCDDGCAAVGLVCTEVQLEAHNADVDTPEKTRALIKKLGGKTLAQTCNTKWGSADDVPNWYWAGCHASSPSRPSSSYSCSARPRGTLLPKYRLCYCHSPA